MKHMSEKNEVPSLTSQGKNKVIDHTLAQK